MKPISQEYMYNNTCCLFNLHYLFVHNKLIHACKLMNFSNSYTYYYHKHSCKGLLVNNSITTLYPCAIEHECGACGSSVYIFKLCNNF